MATEKIFILDESTNQVKPDYDLLKDASVNPEDLIEIKEKKLPGRKKTFNQHENVETKEVFVTGLVLNFSQDLGESRLKSITGRFDIEYLYLYADTILINDKLEFPQANVTLCCRHLIMDELGFVSITPESHPLPYAAGTGADERKAGADGEPAGNITVLCQLIDNRHKKDEPVFILTGGKAQNGEKGETKPKTPKQGYPISFSDVENACVNNDPWPGTTKNWYWPSFDNIDKKKLYYVELHSINSWISARNPRKLDQNFGDKNLPNQDNGADAIASGPGGNGGQGGKISFIDAKTIGKKLDWNVSGGEEGKSELIKGGKKAKDSTYHHLTLTVFHKDVNYDGNRAAGHGSPPSGYYTNSITSRDGYDAKGKDGARGANGSKENLDNSKYNWLHPALLGAMLNYAKTTFRDGERAKARWILERYSEAIKAMPPALKEDMQTAALVREVDMNLGRLNQNLDFYGYPPGWVPMLSVISNLDIILASRRGLAQLLYFANRLLEKDDANKLEAKDLDWTIKELRKGLKTAQADLIAAFNEIPVVKNDIVFAEGEINDLLIELRDLKKDIEAEVADKQKKQAIFEGTFKILAGVCAMVPVGQPYVGQLGGGIMDQVSKIDIDSPNPLKDAFSFAGGLSKKVGEFVKDNESKISDALNSDLKKQIESGTKELTSFTDKADDTAKKLQEAEAELKTRFAPQELSLLTQKIKVMRSMSGGNRSALSAVSDYGDIIADIDEMESAIRSSKDIAVEQKQSLEAKLEKLKKDKATLAKDLKALKAKKDEREKNIKKAADGVKGFTDGVSKISAGLQTMMVEFDPNDPIVKKKMDEIMNTTYKDRFETLNDKITKLNKKKLPLVEKLIQLEQRITENVQRINSSMSQWSVLNDQRVMSVKYGLLPETRATLNRMVQESWELLMMECYYMTKSYQYRFLTKINPVHHGIKQMIQDVENFSKGKDPGSMEATAYEKLFDIVLKSQFKRLAVDLLILKETRSNIKNEYSVMAITSGEKNKKDELILDRLKTHGTATFRLEDLESAKKGTGSWLNYRIKAITFQDITVESAKTNASFDFGIRHSGDSLIRSGNDEKLYYFTSRALVPKKEKPDGQDDKPRLDLQVHSWNGAYNGLDRGQPNKGLSNSTDSHEDDQVLEKLLTDYEIKKDYNDAGKPYKAHYPGGTSELTLMLYDDPKKRNYAITELKFKVEYEVWR